MPESDENKNSMKFDGQQLFASIPKSEGTDDYDPKCKLIALSSPEYRNTESSVNKSHHSVIASQLNSMIEDNEQGALF
jgi:Zn-dependent membrane protease YugP